MNNWLNKVLIFVYAVAFFVVLMDVLFWRNA